MSDSSSSDSVKESAHGRETKSLADSAGETFNACLRELQVFAGGSAVGIAQTASSRWHSDKFQLATEAISAGVLGIACGAAGKDFPEVVNGFALLSTACFAACEAEPLMKAGSSFAGAFAQTWNHSDDKNIAQAYDKVVQGWQSPMFDVALVGAFAAAGSQAYSAGRRMSWANNGDFHPAGGAAYASSYKGKIVNMDAVSTLKLADGFEYSVSATKNPFLAGRLGLKPEPQIGIDNVRQPSDPPLGLADYIRLPGKPAVRDFPVNRPMRSND